MKKQINPTIKAHLIRSAFYVILLLAVCVIPFALAQRNTGKQSSRKAATTQKIAKPGITQRGMTAGPVAPPRQLSPRQRTAPPSSGAAPSRAHAIDLSHYPTFPNSSIRKLSEAPPRRTSRGPAGLCNYTFTTGTDTIVPGDTDTGNHCDDCDTSVALPFSFQLYDQTYNAVNVDSNGRLDFVCVNEPVGYQTQCLPANPNQCAYDYTIYPVWQDMITIADNPGCASFPGGSCGIFTSVSGVAPNRIFNIEWRAVYFNDTSVPVSFEARLYENDPNKRFDIIFGSVPTGGDHDYVSGVQGPSGAFTQDFCDPNPPAAGSRTYTCPGGPTPTPTPGQCQFKVLIVNADCGTPANTLHDQLLAEGAIQVDNFDATTGTPTLGQLQQYDIVVPFSNCGYSDPITLGDNLADYMDGGGVVVAFNFDWFGGSQSIQGRWLTDNYTPYINPGSGLFSNGSLGSFNPSHPLMQGVTTLNAFFRESITPDAGADVVANWNDGPALIAAKGQAVGLSAYVGDFADTWDGQYAKVIINAGNWLHNCQPTPTPTPAACGLLVGSGMTTGFLPNGWEPTLAGNTVNYTFDNSQPAPNEFALFETHDPWGFTVIKDAITSNGHTYTEFTPAQLAGFDFSQYRVVVLNWDDTFAGDFLADYSAAIPALEAYINAGGVVWVQAAMQGCGDVLPMPFGGQGGDCDFSDSDPIVDPASPMMTGMPDPITGSSASHLSYTGLPGAAHVVVITSTTSNPALYDFRPAQCGGGTPTPTPTGTPGCTLNPWQEVAAMPTDLYGAAGASDGTFFYAAGGYSFSQGNTLAVFNRYDPVANSWTPLPDMPQSAIMAVAVYWPTGNKIFVFGGEDAVSGTNYNVTRIYDIGTNTWSTGANMPDVRSFMAGGYSSSTSMIYIVSGYNTGTVDSAQPNTWQYDPGTDTWTDLTGSAPFPHPAGGFAYGVVNDKLYVAGGRDAANQIINLTWEYDPAANTYTQKTDEPGAFQNNVPGSGAAQGVLWVFGGGNPFTAANGSKAAFSVADVPNKQTSSLWSRFMRFLGLKRPATANSGRFYDPVTDTWTNSPNMNEVRSFTSGAAIGDNLIIAAGGYNGNSTVASAETENVCAAGGTPTPTPTVSPSCTPGGSWSEVAALPFVSRGPFCVSDGTFYYIGGGYDGNNVHQDLLRYDPVANTYTPLASAPDAFFLSQAVIANNKIYSIAGFNLGGQSTTTRIYDISTNSWTTGAPLPEPSGLSDAATGLFNGKIYITCGFNGSGASNTLHIYDIATDSWTTGAPAPTAVYLPGFGAINGKFYVASGNNGVGEVNTLQIYDIATDTWTTGAPVPTPVTGPGSVVIGGRLYVFGGSAPFPNNTTITQIYDPGSNSWTAGPNMVVPRLWFYGGALDDSSVLAPGGDNPPGVQINDDEILNLAPCGTPTPTPTATATATATATPTATATATATATPTATQTPRPTPTPRPRPTPLPRPTP